MMKRRQKKKRFFLTSQKSSNRDVKLATVNRHRGAINFLVDEKGINVLIITWQQIWRWIWRWQPVSRAD